MEDLDLYSTIEYSPGWYYKKWPGFPTLEAYRLMEEFSMNNGQIRGERVEKRKWVEEEVEEEKEGQEETKENGVPSLEREGKHQIDLERGA